MCVCVCVCCVLCVLCVCVCVCVVCVVCVCVCVVCVCVVCVLCVCVCRQEFKIQLCHGESVATKLLWYTYVYLILHITCCVMLNMLN